MSKLSPTTNAISAVEQEILNIKKEQNFLYPNFFQIVSFSHNYPYAFFYHPPLDTIFLVPLEKNLQTKLAKTFDNNPPWNLTQTNDDSFIFLVCVEFYNKRFIEDCTGSFSQSYPNHKIIKNIYTKYPVGIYLTKRYSI